MATLTVQRFKRAEVWTAPRCAGGTRLRVLSQLTSLVSSVALAGDSRLAFTVPAGSADALALLDRRVIRVLGRTAGEVDEYRILSDTARLDGGDLALIAVPIALDLANGTLVGQLDADGVRTYDFEGIGLTPAQHLETFVLASLAAIGVTWVSLGTIEAPIAASLIDVVYRGDSPWSAARKVAEAAQAELRLRRDGDAGYVLDLLAQIGADAPLADVREGKNLADLTRERSSVDQRTRVYAFGAALDGVRATMARAVWRVTNVAGSVVTLADPNGGAGPIRFDGQLAPNTAAPDGLAVPAAYLRTAAGALIAVTASSAAAQTVTLASAPALAAGDLVQFRADADGSDLAWLDHPAQVAAAGIKTGTVDRAEISGTFNAIPNPAARDWPDGATLPTGWAAVGTPTLAKETLAPFTQAGGQSVRVDAAADGAGVLLPVAPVPGPVLAAYASLFPVSGQVRVELVLIAAGGADGYEPQPPNLATNTVLGQFQSLGVSGIPAVLPGTTTRAVQARLRVVAHGGPAVFYVDAGQLEAGDRSSGLMEGSGGTRLWQVANAELAAYAPRPETLTVALADLARLDSATWGGDCRLAIGGTVRVVSPRLGVVARVRAVGLEVDHLEPGRTRVTLAERASAGLIDQLARNAATGGPGVSGPVAPAPPTTQPGGGDTAVDTIPLLLALDATGSAFGTVRKVKQWVSAFDAVRLQLDAVTPADAGGKLVARFVPAAGGAAQHMGVGGAACELAADGSGFAASAPLQLGAQCVGDLVCEITAEGTGASERLRMAAIQFLRRAPVSGSGGPGGTYRPPPPPPEGGTDELCGTALLVPGWAHAIDVCTFADLAALDAQVPSDYGGPGELQAPEYFYLSGGALGDGSRGYTVAVDPLAPGGPRRALVYEAPAGVDSYPPEARSPYTRPLSTSEVTVRTYLRYEGAALAAGEGDSATLAKVLFQVNGTGATRANFAVETAVVGGALRLLARLFLPGIAEIQADLGPWSDVEGGNVATVLHVAHLGAGEYWARAWVNGVLGFDETAQCDVAYRDAVQKYGYLYAGGGYAIGAGVASARRVLFHGASAHIGDPDGGSTPGAGGGEGGEGGACVEVEALTGNRDFADDLADWQLWERDTGAGTGPSAVNGSAAVVAGEGSAQAARVTIGTVADSTNTTKSVAFMYEGGAASPQQVDGSWYEWKDPDTGDPTGTFMQGQEDSLFAVEPSTTYRLSCRVRLSAGLLAYLADNPMVSGAPRLVRKLFTAAGAAATGEPFYEFRESPAAARAVSGWQTVAVTFTTPADAAYAWCGVFAGVGLTGGGLTFDVGSFSFLRVCPQ